MSSHRIEQVPIEKITVLPQIRKHFDPGAHQGLAESIRENGILEALLLRRDGDRLVLLNGERRYRAAKEVGLSTVPAVIVDRELTESEVLQQSLVMDCQREMCTPLERALAIDALMKATGWKAAEVAQKTGLSRPTVTKLRTLLSLGDDIREGLTTGAIPMSAGYDLARIDEPGRRAELAKKFTAGELTRDGLAATVTAARRATDKKPVGRAKRATAALGRGRSVTVCGDGLTLASFIVLLEELLSSARLARRNKMTLSTFCGMLKDQAGADSDSSPAGCK
jgi:ParB family transcriptional regulator, chromosome partitioning protein